MAEVTTTTPYATAIPFIASEIPTWLDEYNAQRLASYDLYDDLFDNSPSTVSLLLRGTDEKPIYVPTAKRLIKTLARYVGRGWGYVISPDSGTPDQQTAAMEAFSALFRRERILSQFSNGKAEFLRRGDWVWQIVADPLKLEGTRISVKTIDPRTFFPITLDEDVDRVVGVSLVEEFLLADGKTLAIKEQKWLKPAAPGHPQYVEPPAVSGGTEISYEVNIWDLKDWQDKEKRKLLQALTPVELLPGIISLPIYHIKNGTSTANPFGESELKGLESMLAGINQAITDEDLSLSMAGLGMFETDSGAPVDRDTQQPTNWELGPGYVIEVGQGRHFNRIDGVNSIKPVQDHVSYLEEVAYGTAGVNDIALGSRGAVTESGIALAIRMQPLFDAADDKDLQINDVMTQMFHDLATMYFPMYEGIGIEEIVVTSASDTGNRLPFDRTERWNELVSGFEANIFSLAFVHRVLVEEFGYELTADDLADALAQASTKAAQADPYGERVAGEIAAGEGGEGESATDGEAAE